MEVENKGLKVIVIGGVGKNNSKYIYIYYNINLFSWWS